MEKLYYAYQVEFYEYGPSIQGSVERFDTLGEARSYISKHKSYPWVLMRKPPVGNKGEFIKFFEV